MILRQITCPPSPLTQWSTLEGFQNVWNFSKPSGSLGKCPFFPTRPNAEDPGVFAEIPAMILK